MWREDTASLLIVHFRLASIEERGSPAQLAHDALVSNYAVFGSDTFVEGHELHYEEFEFNLPDLESTENHGRAMKKWVDTLFNIK